MILHPATAHFAIVLPILATIVGILYILKPSETASKVSAASILFAAIFIALAYFAGKEDGAEVYKFLSIEGKSLLKEHAKLGEYLAISMGVVAAIELFAFYKKLFKLEILAVVLVATVAGTTLYQGKMGGELTYTYGAHVKDHAEGRACLAENSMDDDDEEDDDSE